ncbi:MAG: SUMF1/EgtB/PvdO family nonheme iron enzyme [Pirellulales bacterium]
MKRWIVGVVVSAVFGGVSLAEATNIDMVTVGNPGNAPDNNGFGAVPYTYQMGKYEVTVGQYAEFLNAVAKTDTYLLYNGNAPIQRNGSSGSYTYSVARDRANHPVNYVSFWNALRFINWLNNDQPSGSQDASTTEDGAYTLDETCTLYDEDLADNGRIDRNAGAKFFLPAVDEWYKAAYYDPDKPGGAGYWDYPTGTDVVPSPVLADPDPGNNANFTFHDGDFWQSTGSIYGTTPVGAFTNSASPYGTFDQGGNLFEHVGAKGDWASDSVGGCFAYESVSFTSLGIPARMEYTLIGFRVAGAAPVPEPSTVVLGVLGALGIGLGWWRRRKAG